MPKLILKGSLNDKLTHILSIPYCNYIRNNTISTP